jgi:hypothetical protein
MAAAHPYLHQTDQHRRGRTSERVPHRTFGLAFPRGDGLVEQPHYLVEHVGRRATSVADCAPTASTGSGSGRALDRIGVWWTGSSILSGSADGRNGYADRHDVGSPMNEYKRHAVRLVLDSGDSIAEIARSIGVHEMTLRKWVKKGVFRHECGSAEGSGGRVTLRGNGVGRSCLAADPYPFRAGHSIDQTLAGQVDFEHGRGTQHVRV